MAISVGLLLELLLELLLVLREFVATAPSGVCASTRSMNLTFFRTSSGEESRYPAWASDGGVNNAVLRNLNSLIEVIISDHVPDNPGTALLAVIRQLQS